MPFLEVSLYVIRTVPWGYNQLLLQTETSDKLSSVLLYNKQTRDTRCSWTSPQLYFFFSDEKSGLPSIRSSSSNTLLHHVVIRKGLELLDYARIQLHSLPPK